MRHALLVATLTWTACAQPLAPSPRTVDVLDFVVGDQALWPRHGSQNQHQVVDAAGRQVTWTKYTLGWSFETWRWDDAWVYHVVDHAIDGRRRWEHYTFSDGRWLPRYLPVSGWSLDLPDNRIRWVDAACHPQPERPAPYRLRAWLEPNADAGGDLGVRDTLVLEYDPTYGAAPSAVERFYFAKGAGWFRWTRADGAGVTFNELGGVPREPTTWCNEGQDAGFPP
jgi:hypothetical protein